MAFGFYQIKGMQINGFKMYYKMPIDISIHRATVFDDKHVYYYAKASTLYAKANAYTLLGNFKGYGKRNSLSRAEDDEYEVIEFTEDYVLLDDKQQIYCTGIPETRPNMIQLDQTYNDYPVYYEVV